MTHLDIPGADPISGSTPIIAFVGNAIRFSDRMLGILTDEFPDHAFRRFDRIADLLRAGLPTGSVTIVVFEEGHTGAMLSNPKDYQSVAGDAQLVIAFSQACVAAHFLSARGDCPELEHVGLLPLNAQIEVWVSVMRLLMCGQIFLPDWVVRNLPTGQASEQTSFAAPPDAARDLTQREWQVLELVARGLQNKVIAARLSVSEHTVKLHIHNLLRKLGVSNRTLATNWYHKVAAGSPQAGLGGHG